MYLNTHTYPYTYMHRTSYTHTHIRATKRGQTELVQTQRQTNRRTDKRKFISFLTTMLGNFKKKRNRRREIIFTLEILFNVTHFIFNTCSFSLPIHSFHFQYLSSKSILLVVKDYSRESEEYKDLIFHTSEEKIRVNM